MNGMGYITRENSTMSTKILADYPAADISLDSIGDLLEYELGAHVSGRRPKANSTIGEVPS